MAVALTVLVIAFDRAHAADPVAVVIEIRPGTGALGVKRAGETEWTTPRALQALRAGDQLRASGDGRATLTFVGGGTTAVTAVNSPFTVAPPRAESGVDRARAATAGVAQFLLGRAKPPAYQSLSVRGGGVAPPRIISPRDTRLLPGPVTFEWAGPARPDYRVRVHGPGGLVWERDGLPRRPVAYPGSAPALEPGTRYDWSVESPGQAPQRASFEVVSAVDASRIKVALADLGAAGPGGSAGSAPVLLRAGLLFQEGLYADARGALARAIAADPDEPALRQLLGYVYDKVGLVDLAAQEFDEAEFLASRTP